MDGTTDKKHRVLKMIAVLLISIIIIAMSFRAGMVFGAGGEPGSQGDPIVTLSYLESRLAQLEESEGSESGYAASNGKSAAFKRISLSRGEALCMESGTVMVIYSGNGTVEGAPGLLNLTSGEVFGNGTSAVIYSMYMGLSDDSAIRANGNMVIFVSGEYSIK